MKTPMGQDLRNLIDSLGQVFLTIGFGVVQGFATPALILMYSTIDTLGWLGAKEGANSDRERFCAWVDEWLLPSSLLNCDSVDLYAARCSILHSMTGTSRLSRSKKAKRIVYAFGARDKEEVAEAVGNHPGEDFAVIHVDELAQLLKLQSAAFIKKAYEDQETRDEFISKASIFYATLGKTGLDKNG